MTNVDVVVGAQFGSEAKGHVTQRLVDLAREKGRVVYNVRVAGPNAGHSAHTVDGVKLAFRQLPVGVLRPGVNCVIAAGSEIQDKVLVQEIDAAIRYADFDPARLFIDPEATLLEEKHVGAEAGMAQRLGSTGKGIGAARAERIMRRADRVGDVSPLVKAYESLGVRFLDTARLLGVDDVSTQVIIEGTQGYGLGLHAGFYPQCTSSDCRAVDFLAMAGVSPWSYANPDLRIWAIARAFPIRVAGNSGPLAGETTWDELGLEPEYTTVTHKMRRVGQWDADLVRKAVAANGGAPQVRLALTMIDQKFPDLANCEDFNKITGHEALNEWLDEVEAETTAEVEMVTTGPNAGVFF